MAHSFVRVTVHLVFHVKSSSPRLREEDWDSVWRYLSATIDRIGGQALQVGGVGDHVHLLCSLPRDISVAAFIEAIKGSSSRWLKTLRPEYRSFYWQAGYGMFSVSSQNVGRVQQYILGQAEHHRRHTFREEYLSFLAAQGITVDERYVFSD